MFPLMACILGRFSAGRVNNLKFFIAYTSVMHMNAAIVSMLSCQSLSIMRAVCILVSHTLITSALFILNGYLYNRHSNYTFFVFGGLRNTAPLATFFFIFFTLANAALPFSSRFIGEFLMVSSTQANGPYIMVFWVIYLVSSIASTIWFLFRIVFGTSKSNNDNEENLFRRCNIMDLNRTEKLCLTVITFFVVFLRVLPFIMTLF
jgi:NADH-quinone oxidoreductase subunit M